MGEALIDFVSQEVGVKVGEASGYEKAPGGAPANVAVAVERLGNEAAFIGMVGDDPFGHFLKEVLEAEGVELSGLKFTPDARTALAFVSLADTGERSFTFYRLPSADMLLKPEDVALDVIDRGQIFHFGSITLISEPSRSATLAAARHALDAGKLISYDPNLRLALWASEESARAGMRAGLDYANIVKLSDEEVDFLAGGDVEALWRTRMTLIVVTHGAKGATAYTRQGKVEVPAFSVEPVDTTGAGDAFVAGLLVGIMERRDTYMTQLQAILQFANACGALTTTNRGAIPALPIRSQVDEYLEAHTP
jgi:fructokinase